MDSDGAIGQKIGNYIVRHKLGEGGMGVVYLAEHSSIGKQVAIKILRREQAAHPGIVDRFFSEAKAVNDSKHENIIDVLDFGVLSPPLPDLDQPPMVYLIMELLEGKSLSAVIAREAPLPPDRAIRIAHQIADALGAAHRARIIHRDLKPDNVMLIQRGRERDFVKILDFGIAKQVGRAAADPWTASGLAIGTPQYMSPEQCRAHSDIDPRTDVYSLGVVLYEMLTGAVPFDGEEFSDVLFQQTMTPPLAPTMLNSRIPVPLEQVVLKALEKSATDRYQSMSALIAALEDAASYAESTLRALRIPLKADAASPARSSAGAESKTQPVKPLPASGATPLSGSIARLGEALASRRRRGLAITMGVVACVGIGTGLLLCGGTDRSAAVVDHGRSGGAPGTPAPAITVEPILLPVPAAECELARPSIEPRPRAGPATARSSAAGRCPRRRP